MPTRKVTEGVAQYESRIERDFYILLDHCPSIVQFQHQPITISWKDSKGKERKYTPDTLVILRDGTKKLVEIKKEEDLKSLIDDFKEAWQAAAAYAETQGMEFIIITDKVVRIPRFHNIWFFRAPSRLHLAKNAIEIVHLNEMLRASACGIEYNAACDQLGTILGISASEAARVIGYAIYQGLIIMEGFSSHVLSSLTMIMLRPEGKEPFLPLFDCIKPYTMENITKGSISLENKDDTRNSEILELPRFPSDTHKSSRVEKELSKIGPPCHLITQINRSWINF